MVIRQVYQRAYYLSHLVFFRYRVKFQPSAYDCCHDIIVVLNIHGVDYHWIIVGITKSEALNLFKKYWFGGKKRMIMKYKKSYHI